MKLRIKSEQGVAHLALIVVVVVAVVAAAGIIVFTKQKSHNEGKLKADAAGAYSSICGAGYNLMHAQAGNGFTLYNYKNAAGTGCAITVNSNWGVSSSMSVTASWKGGIIKRNAGTYRYYAGPVYYNHTAGVQLEGTRNTAYTKWIIQTN